MEWKKSFKRNEKTFFFFFKYKTSVLSHQGCMVFLIISSVIRHRKREQPSITQHFIAGSAALCSRYYSSWIKSVDLEILPFGHAQGIAFTDCEMRKNLYLKAKKNRKRKKILFHFSFSGIN